MLSLFKIHNFKSILDLTLDFSYNEDKVPDNWESMEKFPFLYLDKNDTKNRFIPTLALFGANASGKSNIIEAMRTLICLLLYPINPIYYKLYDLYHPNKLNLKFNSTSFEVHFFINKEKYEYFIEYNDEQILKEELKTKEKIIFSIDNEKNNFDVDNLQTGSYNKDRFKELFDIKTSKDKKQIKSFLVESSKEYPGIKILSNIIGEILKIITISSTDFLRSIPTDEKEEKDYIPEILSIIKQFDFDIVNIERRDFEDSNIFPSKKIKYKTFHKNINNELVEMDLKEEESLGTNILFHLLKRILPVLKNGGVIFIDELDKSLHPLILIKIIEMFKDKDYNKNNAQLVFTSHCTDILEDEVLKRCEVGIVSKELEKGTEIIRVSDFCDINDDYNLRKLYLTGVLGGIPFPYI